MIRRVRPVLDPAVAPVERIVELGHVADRVGARAGGLRTAHRRRHRSGPRGPRRGRARRSARPRRRRRRGRPTGSPWPPASGRPRVPGTGRGGPPRVAEPAAARRPSGRGRSASPAKPSCVSEAVTSQPMKPPPITVAVRASPARRRSSSESSSVRRPTRSVELARPGSGRDHDRLRLHVVERRQRLAKPELDAVLGVPVDRMHERVLRLRLPSQQTLGERWTVVRTVRVLRPDGDRVFTTAFAVAPRRAWLPQGRHQ